MNDQSSHPAATKDERTIAVEVAMLWGDTVVSVMQWQPPSELWIGEDAQGEPPCDIAVAGEILGMRRAPLLLGESATSVRLVALPTATLIVDLPHRGRLDLDQAMEVLEHQTIDEPQGAIGLWLPLGAVAHQNIGDISFRVSVSPAEVRQKRWSFGRSARMTAGCMALSLLVHLGMGIAGCLASPAEADVDGLTEERRYLIQHYLEVAEQREAEDREELEVDDLDGDQREGGTGTRAGGQEGAMGSRVTGSRYGVLGPQPNRSPQQSLGEDAEFGMIGVLNSGAGGDRDSAASAWGRDDAWGDGTGNSANQGTGRSTSQSGGGGIGFGAGTGSASGYGSGHGRGGRATGLGSLGVIGHGAGTPVRPSGSMSGAGRASLPSGPGQASALEPAHLGIDPNGRFSTNYRPGGGTLAAFESAVARGVVPVAARQLVSDVGASYAPALPLNDRQALAHEVHLERTALPPRGGDVHVRLAFRSTPKSGRGRERLALSLVMDTSGSMIGDAMAQAKQAARQLVDQLRPNDSFSLITFASEAQVVLPSGAVGPRRAQIERAIDAAAAHGGTNIGRGLDLGYVQASGAARTTGAVPVVLLLSDGQATAGDTNRQRLASRALRAFQDGVQTSTFGLGRRYDGPLMSAVAADGAGGYYYLRDGEQIGAAFKAEIEQRLDPAATAIEIRVRLDEDVSLLHVYGSQRLGEIGAARERAKEIAADQQAKQRYGIAQDRQEDRKGGMRFFIPAFARGDRYALLLKLAVPPGVSARQVGAVELRYKDRVFGRNVIEERPIEIEYATSDAQSAGTIDPSVARTVQGHLAGEDLMLAAQSITLNDRPRAASVLRERGKLLRQAAVSLEEPGFLVDAERFARLLSHTSNPDRNLGRDPRALALVLESAARSHLQ